MARKVGQIIARATAAGSSESAHVKMTLTHEEIAEMIGTTRETVRRLFSDFKKKQLLQTKRIHPHHSQQTCHGENVELLTGPVSASAIRTDN